MKDVVIEINSTDIATAVYRYTANAERERNDNAHIATPDNESVIMAFIADATNVLDEGVNMYGGAMVSNGVVLISLSMPERWNDGNIPHLKDACRCFMENFVFARWFEMAGKADVFNEAGDDAIMRIKRILDKRDKPIR